jgi:hypothetical protein
MGTVIIAGLVVASLLVVCAYAFTRSFDHLHHGNSDTGFGYLLASIFGIFGTLIVGLPFIFGGIS